MSRTSITSQSLQERFAPQNRCFGCGPANDKGLRIRSVPSGVYLIASWKPEPHHEAFPGVLNGGIIGSLLDCHSNWTAAYALMLETGASQPPCTVTADYAVRLLRPTPTDGLVHLVAQVQEVHADRAVI